MDWKIFVPIIAVALLLSGCIEAEADVTGADDSMATPEGVQKLVEGNNRFALDLYAKFSETETGNVFFSPWSISSALGMTYEGAREETAEEMLAVMHLPANEIERRSAFAALFNKINEKDKGYALYTANAVWAQNSYPFLESFKETVKKYYLSEVNNVDFVNETEATRQRINQWVELYTNNKIKDLIPENVLTPLTRMVLTNAVYFKGTWLTQFDPAYTREADFRISAEKTVKAQMMSLTDGAEFRFYEDSELQALELPYSGEEVSMLLLLPKENYSIDSLGESISAQKLGEISNSLREQEVKVYVPKFRFETKYFMGKQLAEMGMPTAFSGSADFTGMYDASKSGENLYIGNVIHQAFVEVNDEGTEAAAATAVVVVETSMPTPVPSFVADHPFIFIIRENSTGQILFMGRVADPTEE